MAKRHWLFKGGEDCHNIADFLKEKDQTAMWKSTRNYTVRNWLRDEIKRGDAVLFYHSGGIEPGVVGIAEVASAPYPDPTQFDTSSPYYDEKATKSEPRWWNADVKVKRQFKKPVLLRRLKETPGLEDMMVTQRGNRFSITPVTPEQWKIVTALGR